MKERYVLLSLCERLISYSLCLQVKKDQHQNNFQLDLSEDEIRMLVNLINKRIEELADEKEGWHENNQN